MNRPAKMAAVLVVCLGMSVLLSQTALASEMTLGEAFKKLAES